MIQFHSRYEAGQVLAKRLTKYTNRAGLLVLGLPRGGVPVAYEVAKALAAPLDVFIVRKLGVPNNEELAMGAVASGGLRVLNGDVIEGIGIPADLIESVTARELREVERRENLYRGQRPPLDVQGKLVILVDDGIATGATVRAAVLALRQLEPIRIVVATPVVSMATVRKLKQEVDELVAVMTPPNFSAVGQSYENFSQTTDDEVRELLKKSEILSEPC